MLLRRCVCALVVPRYIVYDNACNLATYALSREPLLFRDTVFAVDALHFKGHVGCCAALDSKRYPEIALLNTSRNEQENSVLQRVKGYVQYMKQFNFMYFLRFFFAFRNMQLSEKA